MRQMQSRAYIEVHVDLEPPVGSRKIVITPGKVVDFDEVVRPARPGRPALTLAEALGEQVGDETEGRPARQPNPDDPDDKGDPGEPAFRPGPGHTQHFDPYTPPAVAAPAKAAAKTAPAKAE